MKTLEHIASELAGYDPQALSADMVNNFLGNLVDPVTEVEEVDIFEALGRVLAQDAFVSLPEIALGIPLTWGTIPRLVNLLGPAKAKRLTILCERIAAPEALTMGLVDHVSETGQALTRAQALAAQTLAQPAATVRMSKESVNAAATALNHASSYMAHDQIALAASSPESRAARDQALR